MINPVLDEEELKKQGLNPDGTPAMPVPAPPAPIPAPAAKLPPAPAGIDPRVVDYVLKNAQKPAPPTQTPTDNEFGAGQALSVGLAGLGDAISASAGRSTNAAKTALETGAAVKKAKEEGVVKARDLALQKEMDDPASDVSKQYQVIASKMLGKKPEELGTMSATRISTVLPVVEKAWQASEAAQTRRDTAQMAADARRDAAAIAAAAAKGSRDSLQSERDARRQERMDNNRRTLIDKFNADPSTKKSQQSLDAAGDIRDLANSGNPIAAAAIPTYSARMSGEVGNLSEADKAPFGGSQAIMERVNKALNEWANGQLTPHNKTFILGLTKIIQKRAGEKMDSLARLRARQYSKMQNYGEEDEIYNSLRPGAATPAAPPAGAPAPDAGGEQPVEVATEEEALKLPVGTKFTLKGRVGTVQ